MALLACFGQDVLGNWAWGVGENMILRFLSCAAWKCGFHWWIWEKWEWEVLFLRCQCTSKWGFWGGSCWRSLYIMLTRSQYLNLGSSPSMTCCEDFFWLGLIFKALDSEPRVWPSMMSVDLCQSIERFQRKRRDSAEDTRFEGLSSLSDAGFELW